MVEHHNDVGGTAFGPVVQARDISGDVHISHTPTPLARSRYREQVRQIAPPELLGRAAEMAWLHRFCTDDDVPHDYLWWRAPKWAGKSALMACFVLDPPPGVRVVSFFVTGRLAGQDHRAAFVDVLVEQLAELLGEPMPVAVSEATREAHLIGMVTEAAQLCRDRGERLVLVVDGLDEDRGLVVGARSHSIAALLPTRLAAGMRVVVTSRPNPPPPADVGPHHPLRDPAVAHDLPPSPHALVLRDDMELELDRLLGGDPAARDLLGLLTAAGGGLSARDLGELTGRGERDVRALLRTVAGRTFDVRPGHWHPETAIYLLGHEELQTTAEEGFGPAGLAGYRARLHAWADRHRAAGWPEDTPEYLLRGYFRLLVATGEVARVVACAIDPARHDRMLSLSGSDLGALGEITAAQAAVLATAEPDAVVLARLSYHRERLTDRNATIPSRLPALWAALGRTRRVEVPADPASAVALCVALAERGQFDRADEVLRGVDGIEHRDEALAGIAVALARHGAVADALVVVDRVFGGVDRAVATAELAVVTHRDEIAGQARALLEALAEHNAGASGKAAARLAGAAAALGDLALARRFLQAVDEPRWGSRARAAIARAGDPDAAELIDTADRLAEGITDPDLKAAALADLAVATDDLDRLARAERAGPLGPDAVAHVVRAAALLGRWEHAETLCGTLAPGSPAVLVALGEAAASAGRTAAAERIAAVAEGMARDFVDDRRRDAALAALVAANDEIGDTEAVRALLDVVEAEGRGTPRTTAPDPPDPDRGPLALDDLIRRTPNAFTRARGLLALARTNRSLLFRATAAIEEIQGAAHRVRLDAAVVTTMAGLGDLDQAVAHARSVGTSVAMVAAVKAVAATEDFDRALSLVGEITDPVRAWEARGFVVKAVAVAGDVPRALSLLADLPAGRYRDKLVEALAAITTGSSRSWVADLLPWADRIADAPRRARTVSHLITAALRHGDRTRARSLVDTVEPPALQARAWAALLDDPGAHAAAHILHLLDWPAALPLVAARHPEVVQALTADVLGR
ncbi:hypothetical protein [Saccharothrix variisporea]|uniref:NACHT domain-containing protein n=1 Tax=Saccharothrix variisporea TaxID=543527 RepID=A0A495XCF5_9PSEU|nr:hypothetical protein [Saccharothrix variisporea]RKT69218.1 hypothetical protein DFJ66_2415 [Saccharothrix variisporea]